MEYDNINISNVEDIIEQTVKEQIEKLMKIEQDQYLEENPGIKNGHYKRNLRTKYGELKELKVPRNRDNKFHSAVIEYNKTIGLEELITSLYSNGVSTRKISDILNNIFKNRYSPSSISRITDITLEEVNKFLNRLKPKIKEKNVEIVDDANRMFKCINKEEAIIRSNEFKNNYERRYPDVIYNTEIKLGELLRFYDYPLKIRNSLKSTNIIERMNEEIRRRIKTISSFPDEDSAMKIFYLKSIEFNSKHIFRKINGYIKCNDEIKEMFNKRYPL